MHSLLSICKKYVKMDGNGEIMDLGTRPGHPPGSGGSIQHVTRAVCSRNNPCPESSPGPGCSAQN